MGVVIAFISQIIIFKHYGYSITWETNAWMTLWFTAVSLCRSFILRRIFNRITVNKQPNYWEAIKPFYEQKEIQSVRTDFWDNYNSDGSRKGASRFDTAQEIH